MVTEIQYGWKYLLVEANGEWSFVKGIVEKGETLYQVAIREVTEETSISDSQFSWGANYTQTIPAAGHSDTYYYLARSLRADIVLPTSQELGKPENDCYDWFSFDAGRDLLAPHLREALAWANQIIAGARLRKMEPAAIRRA